MVYDEVAAELGDPLPPADDEAEPTTHDTLSCQLCRAWSAHIREAEGV